MGTNTISLDIARALKEMREAKGVSPKQLATLIGLAAPGYVYRVESGHVGIGIMYLTRMAVALGCRVSDIVLKAESYQEVSSGAG